MHSRGCSRDTFAYIRQLLTHRRSYCKALQISGSWFTALLMFSSANKCGNVFPLQLSLKKVGPNFRNLSKPSFLDHCTMVSHDSIMCTTCGLVESSPGWLGVRVVRRDTPVSRRAVLGCKKEVAFSSHFSETIFSSSFAARCVDTLQKNLTHTCLPRT